MFESGTVKYVHRSHNERSVFHGVLRYFPLANDNATRRSDAASLAITDRRARPRYLDKAEESRRLLKGEGEPWRALYAHTGEILPGILSDLHGGERVAYSRRSARDVDWWSWRAVRKIGGAGGGKREGRVEGIRPGWERERKKASRPNTYTFLLFAHTYTHTYTRTPRRAYAYRWLRLCRTHVSVCPTWRRDAYIPTWRTMWKRAVVSLEIIINIGEWRSIFRSPSLDNNKRIIGERGEEAGEDEEPQKGKTGAKEGTLLALGALPSPFSGWDGERAPAERVI